MKAQKEHGLGLSGKRNQELRGIGREKKHV